MPSSTANNDVTAEDIRATAQAKAEEVKDTAQNAFEDAKERLSNLNLTLNQKLILTGVAAVAASLLIQKFGKRLRPVRIDAERLILIEPSDVVSK
jgi:hypothetical protein